MPPECNVTAIEHCPPGARSRPSDSGVVFHAAVLLICGAALAGAVVLTPHVEGLSLFGYRWPFYCWLHETLGIKCALCGLSRSFSTLAHGDIHAALQFHRLGPAVFALFCLQIPYRLYALALRPRPVNARLRRAHAGLVALVATAVLAHWIVYLGGLIL